MTEKDFYNFSKLLSAVFSVYQKTITTDVMTVWWGALKHIEFSAIREALSAHIQNPDNGQFLPKPADVIRLLGGTTTDRAKIAWTKVDKAVRTIGTYRDVAFDDPIIHKVIEDMGGWIWFGKQEDREWPFVENNFVTRYRSYVISGVDTYPSVLIGAANMYNIRNGSELHPTYLFGDTEKARLVITNASKATQNKVYEIVNSLLPEAA